MCAVVACSCWNIFLSNTNLLEAEDILYFFLMIAFPSSVRWPLGVFEFKKGAIFMYFHRKDRKDDDTSNTLEVAVYWTIGPYSLTHDPRA